MQILQSLRAVASAQGSPPGYAVTALQGTAGAPIGIGLSNPGEGSHVELCVVALAGEVSDDVTFRKAQFAIERGGDVFRQLLQRGQMGSAAQEELFGAAFPQTQADRL